MNLVMSAFIAFACLEVGLFAFANLHNFFTSPPKTTGLSYQETFAPTARNISFQERVTAICESTFVEDFVFGRLGGAI